MDKRSECSPLYAHQHMQFHRDGISYQSNKLLLKTAAFPYPILLEVVKLLHLTAFQIILFTHMLSSQKAKDLQGLPVFKQAISIPSIDTLASRVIKQNPHTNGNQHQDSRLQNQSEDHGGQNITCAGYVEHLEEITRQFVYILSMGYACKFYLNESMELYADEIKRVLPDFFPSVFNPWIEKYGNQVFSVVTPRALNSFYARLIEEESPPPEPAPLVVAGPHLNEMVSPCEAESEGKPPYTELVEQLIKDIEWEQGGKSDELTKKQQ